MHLRYTTALAGIMLLTVGASHAEAPMPAAGFAEPQQTDSAAPALPEPETARSEPAPMPVEAEPPVLTEPLLTEAAPEPSGNPFATSPAGGAPPAEAGALVLPLAQDAAPAKQPAAQVDDRALRFYAAQRELGRVEAETKRLKALYPGWQPPVDIFSPTRVSVDEQPLWDLFAQGKFAEVRREITLRAQKTPSWRPSDDLMRKLNAGEARAKVMNAARFARWDEVVKTAAASKGLLVCANMDVLWAVGEALAKSRKPAQSLDVYRYAVANCPNERERLATVQKASQQLSPESQDALISLAAQSSQSPQAYEAMRFDALRQAMGEAAIGKRGKEIPQAQLERFATYVNVERSAEDAGLLGWYFYSLGDFVAAEAWFKAGAQESSEAKLTEGYILALRKQGRNQEAEAVAYKNRLKSAEIKVAYTDIVAEQLTIDSSPDVSAESNVVGIDVGEDTPSVAPYELSKDDVVRFARFVLEERSPLGSQALGWHALNEGDFKTAQDWFDKSVEWKPTEGGVIGAAVAAARLKQPARVRAIKAAYVKDYPALEKFGTGQSPRGKVLRKRSKQ